MKEYFYKKEYKNIYLGCLSYNFANALIETFGTVMLYKSGVPIWMILLIYGFRFVITGLCTPLFITISANLGISKCILISNIFSIISAYMMLNSKQLNENILMFVFIIGLMGISNPSSDALSSKYVDTEHRGRFNSILNITKIVATAIASCLISWGILSKNNVILFIILTISFLLHYVFIKKIDYKPASQKKVFGTSLKYVCKSKSKYKLIYALKANHMIERFFAPLYLYIILANFKSFSFVIIASLLFQIITITLIGKYTDKNIGKSNNLVTVSKAFITSIYLFTKNKTTISINKTISDNLEKLYETSIQTSIQNIIKDSSINQDMLSTTGQMSLCFAEFFIFIFLSILSHYFGTNIFYIIFILSIISTILINVNIRYLLNRK